MRLWLNAPYGEAATGRQYAHQNRLGSVVATTDANGNTVDTFTYSPYGVDGSEAGTTGFPFRFTGQKLDPETGLYYYKARYYDPETGRFLQTDPIGYEDQMNLYAYVGNDPVNFTDPTGLRRGENLTYDEWEVVSARAAEAGELANEIADNLEAGDADTIEAFENAFGEGSATAENISKVTGQLRKIGRRLTAASNEKTGPTIRNATAEEEASELGSANGFVDGSENRIVVTQQFYSNSSSSQRTTLLHEGHHQVVPYSGHLPRSQRPDGSTTGSRYLRRARQVYQDSSFYYTDPAFQDCLVTRSGC